IAVDASGNPLIAYQTGNTGGSGGVASGQTNTGSTDIVVFKLDSVTGNTVWVRQQPTFNTTSDDVTPSIAIDASGNALISYFSIGTASGQTNMGFTDIVVFKLNTNGDTQWVRQQPTFNTNMLDGVPKIGVDSTG